MPLWVMGERLHWESRSLELQGMFLSGFALRRRESEPKLHPAQPTPLHSLHPSVLQSLPDNISFNAATHTHTHTEIDILLHSHKYAKNTKPHTYLHTIIHK